MSEIRSTKERISGAIGFLLAGAGLTGALVLQSDAGLPRSGSLYCAPFLIAFAASWTALLLGKVAVKITGGIDSPRGSIGELFLSGLCLFSLWPILLHHAGLFRTEWIVAPLVAGPIVGLFLLMRRSSMRSESADQPPHADGVFEIALLFITGLALLWGALSVFAPPTGMDALTYHLGLPGQYLARGSITPPDSLGYYYYWQLYEMSVLPLIAADPSGIAANMIGWPIFLALIAGCYSLGSSLGGRRSGLLVAAASATSPILLILLTHTKNDILAAALVVWGILPWFESGNELKTGRALRGAFLLGGALAVKPTSAFVIIPFFAMTAWQGRRAPRLLLALASAAILPAYWAIRNLAAVGHLLAPNIVESVPVSGYFWGEIPGRLMHLATSFFVFISFNIDGPIGPALLVLAIAAALGRRDARRTAIAGISIAALVFWLVAGRGQARFMLPAILLAAAAGAAALEGAAIQVAEASRRRLHAAVLIGVIVSFGVSIRLLERQTSFLMMQSGRMSVEEFVSRWINTGRLHAAANRTLPENVDIIAVGDARHFPLKRRVISDGYWERSRVLERAHEDHSPAHLHAWLKEKGFEYLLYNPAAVEVGIARGDVPSPRCGLDTRVLESMLSDPSFARRVLSDAKEARLAVYEIR